MRFAIRIMGRILRRVGELAVGGCVVGAMRADVDEAGLGRLRHDDVSVRHREEPEVTAALVDPDARRLHHGPVPHRRDMAPRQVGREKTPVVEHVSGHGIRDVVGRQRDEVHIESNFAGLQISVIVIDEPVFANGASVDLKRDRHGEDAMASRREQPDRRVGRKFVGEP